MKIIPTVICAAFSFLHSFSQTPTGTSETIIQAQVLSSKEAYYLVSHHSYLNNDSSSIQNLRYEIQLKYTNDDGKTFTLCNLDTLTARLEGPLSSPSLNLHFVNKDLGFIYGFSAVYAFYPLLFRTDDGGKTWQTIYAGGMGTPFRRSDFFMFNTSQGIIVNNWNSQPDFHYMLTQDGGKTWKQCTYKISRNDIRILNADGYLSEVYSEDGRVTVIFNNND
ncbi:MAG: WD40/YVTN/BNR-like repeat-containing protein, partial [Flavobacteriia bacterium]